MYIGDDEVAVAVAMKLLIADHYKRYTQGTRDKNRMA